MTKKFNNYGTLEDRISRLENLLGVSEGSGVGNLLVLIGSLDAEVDDLSGGIASFAWEYGLYSEVQFRYENVTTGEGIDSSIGYAGYNDGVAVNDGDFDGLYGIGVDELGTGKGTLVAPDTGLPMFVLLGTTGEGGSVNQETGPFDNNVNRVDIRAVDYIDFVATPTPIITGKFFCYGVLKAAVEA